MLANNLQQRKETVWMESLSSPNNSANKQMLKELLLPNVVALHCIAYDDCAHCKY